MFRTAIFLVAATTATLAFTSVPSLPLSSRCHHCSSSFSSRSGMVRFASNRNENDINDKSNNKDLSNFLRVTVATSIISLSTLSPLPSQMMVAANAFEESDYASETVTAVVKRLDEAAGNVDQTFSTFEEVAAIITEGKGVGGSISYTGVKLDRGYIADEDTSIYNPGLTLLTESEKERLTNAIIHSRQVGLSNNQWSENNEFAYDFLKQKLDPLHMAELKGYLGILPYWGAAVYLIALGVQQFARDAFTAGYAVAAAMVFGPIFALIAKGP